MIASCVSSTTNCGRRRAPLHHALHRPEVVLPLALHVLLWHTYVCHVGYFLVSRVSLSLSRVFSSCEFAWTSSLVVCLSEATV